MTAVHDFLRDLITALEMNALGYHLYDVPIALKRQGVDPLTDEGGITGVAVLSTSHVALHTWPEVNGATFDLHSCRDYDPALVERALRKHFGAEEVHLYDLTFSLK